MCEALEDVMPKNSQFRSRGVIRSQSYRIFASAMCGGGPKC